MAKQLQRHDSDTFSASDFEPFTTEPKPSGEDHSSTAEEQARKHALRQPSTDANEIRDIYSLPKLSDDDVQLWLDGEPVQA